MARRNRGGLGSGGSFLQLVYTDELIADVKTFEKFMSEPMPRSIIVVPGGADILEDLYTTRKEDLSQYDWREAAVIRRCVNESHPMLAICRGHQMLAAVLGGDLIQDLDDAGYTQHYHGPVMLDKRSTLAKILDEHSGKVAVNSLHHQAVRAESVPDGWEIVALSYDGVVEAIENKNLPIVSVQWHPELTEQIYYIMAYLSQWR